MEIHEFVDEGLGHSSYLVAVDGSELVVDPPRFRTAIERAASDLALTIRWTADTHSHADYVTMRPPVARRSGPRSSRPRPPITRWPTQSPAAP